MDCEEKTRPRADPICELCGGIVETAGICAACRNYPPLYSALRSYTIYKDEIRKAIHRLKYGGDISLGEILSRPMIKLLNSLNWEIDLVVPVPNSLVRKKMRGYNQASLIAYPIALSCGIPYLAKALERTRDTRSQVGLSAAERHENVRAAFRARRELIAGKSVLLIDDLLTSGATVASCTKAMLEQDACQVYGLTLARTVLKDSLSL